MEKTIYSIKYLSELIERKHDILLEKYKAKILTIPFEKFVIGPWPYLRQIEESLGTKVTSFTHRVMKKQKVPRKMYAQGVGLKIYKRCGWEPPKTTSEKEELRLRREFAAKEASAEAMQALDQLSVNYEKKYLADKG
jgi:hypothetical protein